MRLGSASQLRLPLLVKNKTRVIVFFVCAPGAFRAPVFGLFPPLRIADKLV